MHLDGLQIHVSEAGNGPPVLLLISGLGDDHADRPVHACAGAAVLVTYADESAAAAAAAAEQIPVWQLPDQPVDTLLRVLASHTGSVTAVAISPDGTRLATGSHDGTTVPPPDGAAHQVRLLRGPARGEDGGRVHI